MNVTVEPCVAPQMETLTSSLELFNTFKTEVEKDSDEESFHLPLLECDDDAENIKKEKVDVQLENVDNIKEENEDDILNKFDITSAATDAIDPRLEDSLLDDKEDPNCQVTKENENKGNQCNSEHKEETDKNEKENENTSMDVDVAPDSLHEDNENCSEKEVDLDKDKNVEDMEATEPDNKEMDTEKDANVKDNRQREEMDTEKVARSENNRQAEEIVTEKGVVSEENKKTEEMEVTECSKPDAESGKNTENPDDSSEDDSQKTIIAEKDTFTAIDGEQSSLNDELNDKVDEENDPKDIGNDSADTEKLDSEDIVVNAQSSEDQVRPEVERDCDNEKNDKEIIECIPNKVENPPSEEATKKMEGEISSELQKKTEAMSSKSDACSTETVLDDGTEKEEIVNSNNESIAPTKEATPVDEADKEEQVNSSEETIDRLQVSVSPKRPQASASPERPQVSTSPKRPRVSASPERPQVSASPERPQVLASPERPHASPSPNQDECDDLLDISIIRDQDEDDAHLAECANEATPEDKDLMDVQDETSNEKTEIDEDVETVIVNKDDKDGSEKVSETNDNEPMEIEDDFDENHEKENEAISLQLESGKDDSTEDMETDIPKIIENASSPKDHGTEEISEVPKTPEPQEQKPQVLQKENVEPIVNEPNDKSSKTSDLVKEEIENKIPPPVKETSDATQEPVKEQTLERPSSKSTKRPLGQTNHVTSATKRIKLTPEIEEKYKIKSLVNLADFMKNKRLKKLTRADLEEFCVQKICEVIVHKSEIGDINQQLRLYEQMVEQLRKDQQQLNKQVRDLEIVNKKLMQELKCKDNQKKPLVPLKITRSVGLQVKLTVPDMTVKRRPVLPPPQQKTVLPAPVNNNRIQQRPAQTNTTPSVLSPRPVVQSPQKQTPTPILTSVLQNRRTSQGTPVKTSPAQPIRPKPSENKGGSVIDLTDEDDKKNEKKVEASPKKVEPPTKKAVANTVTTPGRTVATIGQGVRLTTPTQVKTTPITGVTTSTPQLMYVLQPGTQLSSGVITTAAGGTQKAVLLNFQSNGILTTPTLNGSAVSVIPKATSTVQAKPAVQPKPVIRQVSRHPAPLPIAPVARLPNEKSLKPVPPKPYLSIRKTDTGIILQWRMPYDLDMYEVIASYQLYAYQETSSPPTTDMWRRVGDVKALALPMACTLTQFADKNKYYFAVRPVDIYKRIGAFSDPEEISL